MGVAFAGSMVVSGRVGTLVRVPAEMEESGTAVGLVAASEKGTTGRPAPVGVGVAPEAGGAWEMGGLWDAAGEACLGRTSSRRRGLCALAKRGTVMAVSRASFMATVIGEVKTVFGGR